MDIIELMNAYRQATNVEKQLALAKAFHDEIKEGIRKHLFARKFQADLIDDALQEALVVIFDIVDRDKFRGKTKDQFWKGCNRTARNKAYDQIRKQRPAQFQPLPPEELLAVIDASERTEPLSPQDRLDLKDALNLLYKAKPKCFDLLWKFFVIGLKPKEIAKELGLKYDAVLRRIERCLAAAQGLI